MNQTPSSQAAALDAMPFEMEIRTSAQQSMKLRRQMDQLFALMREPLTSEAQMRARLEALQGFRAESVSNPSLMEAGQKPAVSSGGTRRLLLSRFI